MKNFSEIIAGIPENSGVYIMKDIADEILYIGKAINLKKRVSSYFNDGGDGRFQLPALVSKIENIEFIVCQNETEALLLEANLVRAHKPPYNLLLKDDKHYPYIKITKNSDEFARILIVRKVEADKNAYFGPFTDTTQLRLVVGALKKILKIRSCNLNISSKKTLRPCINAAMKLCLAPCNQSVSAEDYAIFTEQAIKFFQGQQREMISFLENQMADLSQNLEYEKAANIRDILFGIKKLVRKQNIDFRNPNLDCDVFAACEQNKFLCFTTMNVRNGNLINQNNKVIPITAWHYDDRAKLIVDYYTTSANAVPKSIVLSQEFSEEEDLIRDFISQKYKARTFVAKNGYAAKLVNLAQKNCQIYLAQTYINNPTEILEELARVCKLPKIPITIEAFDISNVGDKFCVAGMVSFVNGMPNKADYRRFKIKTVSGQNDFAMMMEAVKRRLSRLVKEEKPFPDLLLIDGGKGQLSAAQKAISQFENPPMVISIIEKKELIISPHCNFSEIQLGESHPVRRLLQRIRDEVHRYAITYHKKIRGRQFNHTILLDIEGIGEKKAEALLKTFGSVQEISEKSVEELMTVEGIGKKDAELILVELKEMF
ncbi:MAG: excinuclease ABC subunit UvrC [Chitinivibrionia bacterium]|nr:excinuclease ABC subunit UvrC [Chitinivibrionia bacterium]